MDDSEPEYEVLESDIEIEWFSGSGAGGQHRNKHQNSCRLRHVPTGTVTQAQCRSRKNSYREAYESLVSKIHGTESDQRSVERGTEIREKMGTGARGDKIRTIRFQDDRAKDHRTGRSVSATKYMSGFMDSLWC